MLTNFEFIKLKLMISTRLYLSQIYKIGINNFNLESDLNTTKEEKKTKKKKKISTHVTFDY